MSVFAYPDPRRPTRGFFMLVLAAGERDADAEALPRDVTIVLDRSGSMQGEKFEQATGAALQVIRALGPEERFRIVDYSSDVASSGPATGATPDAIKAAAARLADLKAVGGTNINEALLEAIRPEPAGGTLPIVLFLTDGLPTVGVTAEKAIRDNVLGANASDGGGTRRLFTFGVGHDVNVPLLTDLARESRAVADFVAPGEDVEAAVGRVFARLTGPVLTDVSLAAGYDVPEGTGVCGTGWIDPISELFPRQMGDLFESQRLIVLGRYAAFGDDKALFVSAETEAGEQRFRIPFDPADARVENATSPACGPSRRSPGSSTSSAAPAPTRGSSSSTACGTIPNSPSSSMRSSISRPPTASSPSTPRSSRPRRACSRNSGQNQRARQEATSQAAAAARARSSRITAEPSADAVGKAAAERHDRGSRCEFEDLDLQSRVDRMSSHPDRRSRTSAPTRSTTSEAGGWTRTWSTPTSNSPIPPSDRPEPDETIAFGTDRYFAVNFTTRRDGPAGVDGGRRATSRSCSMGQAAADPEPELSTMLIAPHRPHDPGPMHQRGRHRPDHLLLRPARGHPRRVVPPRAGAGQNARYGNIPGYAVVKEERPFAFDRGVGELSLHGASPPCSTRPPSRSSRSTTPRPRSSSRTTASTSSATRSSSSGSSTSPSRDDRRRGPAR
jgi:uncharacterized protein YegL